jgi:hypothetical protein
MDNGTVSLSRRVVVSDGQGRECSSIIEFFMILYIDIINNYLRIEHCRITIRHNMYRTKDPKPESADHPTTAGFREEPVGVGWLASAQERVMENSSR